jgi:hypothetical protein
MPIVNVRNSQATAMQATDFPQRQDHFTGVINLAALVRSAPALIDGWIMSPIARDANYYQYYPGLVEPLRWTSTVNTVASLSNPGTNIYRHGLIGSAKLGEVTLRALQTTASIHNSRTISEGWSATQGLWTMVGLYFPATALAPTAVITGKTIFAKFRFDSNAANYQFSWELEWRYIAALAATRIVTQLSATGNSSVTFYGDRGATPGSYHIVGFIYAPVVSVTTFVDNNFRTAAAPDAIFNGHPNVVPAALNAAVDTPVTVARRQTVTAGFTSNPSADAYYHFAMYGHAALTIQQWLSMYYLVKPVLGYNTNLGGV